jgi:hypothetical protein
MRHPVSPRSLVFAGWLLCLAVLMPACVVAPVRAPGTAQVQPAATSPLSHYPAYLQGMIQQVHQHWSQVINYSYHRGRQEPPRGAQVDVTFVLTESGSVRIRRVEGDAPLLWQRLAVDSIAAAARRPGGYGPWTPEMQAQLGREQELVFSFHYQ